jgi:hypothetical protein
VDSLLEAEAVNRLRLIRLRDGAVFVLTILSTKSSQVPVILLK